MKSLSKTELARKIVQLAFFAAFPGIFVAVYSGIKSLYMGIFHQTADISEFFPEVALAVMVVLATVFLGRFFCGWMCAFGALQDWIFELAGMFRKRKTKVPAGVDAALKKLKYAVLLLAVIFIWTIEMSPALGYNPIDAFGVISSDPGIESLKLLFESFLPGTVIMIIILLTSAFIERFFCRYLCPTGAIFALGSRLRMIFIRKNREECSSSSCKLCTNNCSMGIDMSKHDEIHSGECIDCLKCIDACRKSNTRLTVLGKEANHLAVVLVSVALISGVILGGNSILKKSLETKNAETDTPIGTSEKETSESSGYSEDSEVKEEPAETAEPEGIYKDGIYEGTGIGFRGETRVSVVVENGLITDIEVLDSQDDEKFLVRAESGVVGSIIDTQSLEVDAVSGATYSSDGIMEAVKDAVE
ncbi:putative electron transport protein YccM [Andreesenia angusta]|uniref:Putative electron transport protein YccM n=1 Tax=Andreesenia angusta TaxID=39480 RepID=A0A1S1VA96_9FIRM|nr:4Fe-4S binding protein [Andreesenia angusta]OHW63340.1 putative electron transport protein YccM [Andreesenia angusta]